MTFRFAKPSARGVVRARIAQVCSGGLAPAAPVQPPALAWGVDPRLLATSFFVAALVWMRLARHLVEAYAAADASGLDAAWLPAIVRPLPLAVASLSAIVLAGAGLVATVRRAGGRGGSTGRPGPGFGRRSAWRSGRRVEQRMERIVDALPGMAALVDRAGTVVYVNLTFRRLLSPSGAARPGLPLATVLGSLLPPLHGRPLLPDQGEAAFDLLLTDRSLTDEAGGRLDARFDRGGGGSRRERRVGIRVRKLDDRDDGLGWLVTGDDDAEMREVRADHALKSAALDMAGEAVAIADARGDMPVLYVNRAFQALTGYSAGETRGRNLRFLQGEDRDQSEIDRLRAAFAASRPVSVTLQNYRRDGSPFLNEMRCEPLRDAHGRASHYVAILREAGMPASLDPADAPDRAPSGVPEGAPSVDETSRLTIGSSAIGRRDRALMLQSVVSLDADDGGWDAGGGGRVGAAALARGPQGPDFREAASDASLGGGEWAVRMAASLAAGLGEAGSASLPISVSVAPERLEDPELAPTLAGILRETGASASMLTLEFSERAVADASAAALGALERLRAMGFGIALDDFGAGVSSLSLLDRLPVTEIEIDRNLVMGCESSGYRQTVIAAFVAIGQTLALKVTAKGVETEAQRRVLSELGVRRARGFLFGAPVEAAEFAAMRRCDLRPAPMFPRPDGDGWEAGGDAGRERWAE